jgi:hypothetical protein
VLLCIFIDDDLRVAAAVAADVVQEDGWVVFKVFKKTTRSCREVVAWWRRESRHAALL